MNLKLGFCGFWPSKSWSHKTCVLVNTLYYYIYILRPEQLYVSLLCPPTVTLSDMSWSYSRHLRFKQRIWSATGLSKHLVLQLWFYIALVPLRFPSRVHSWIGRYSPKLHSLREYKSIYKHLQIALIWVCFQTTGVKKSVLWLRSQPAATSVLSVLYSECFLLKLSEQRVHHLGSVSSFGFRWQPVITKVRRLSSCLWDWLCVVFIVILEPLRKLVRKSMVEAIGAESPSGLLIHLPWGVKSGHSGQGRAWIWWALSAGREIWLRFFRGTPHPWTLLVYHGSVLLDWKWNCWKLKERQIKCSKTLTTVILTCSHVFPLYLNPPMYLS